MTMTDEAATGFRVFSRGGDARILFSHHGMQATAAAPPAFPWVQYHAGLTTYDEALIDGRFVVVNWSAMGRPTSRERIWSGCDDTVVRRAAVPRFSCA